MREDGWAVEQGFIWPEDLRQVSANVIGAFRPGRPVARRWSHSAWANPPRENIYDLREIAVSRLLGSGIEVGAGTNPLPIPLHCHVRYVDMYDESELSVHSYPGQLLADLVVPDVVASLEALSPFDDECLDFVATCHVIEHTRDPIGALAGAWRSLRPGGAIVLVVPEYTRTFDRFRPLTTLEHLIQDFRQPDPGRERDQAHFREFYALALPATPSEYESVWRQKWSEAFPIHYHTWSHESFGVMVRWMNESGVLPGLTEVWSQPPLPDPRACNEFWYVLMRDL
jgi:SAM-dependent methyltransferase